MSVPAARTYRGGGGELFVVTPAVGEGGVEIDGVLDDALWSEAARLTDFTQFDPSEGIPGSEVTDVYVLVSEDAVYFGVEAFMRDPTAIRATLSERDGFTRSDDYVRVVLDTFDDQRRAFVFSVNPYGVQHDGLWVEGGGGRGGRGGFGPPIDSSPDFIWTSDARIHERGWTAEIRVPLKSLRFPEVPIQDWGFNVFRSIQSTGFQQSWAPLTDNRSNQLGQAGKLTQLRDLDPGLFLEINPVVTGIVVGEFDEETGGLEHGSLQDEYGLNARYGLTSNLTLDATVNPDFSQVEADAGQIAVNERFALRFPEQRPFFLEGTEVFSLPKSLIFTRTIVDPLAGAKITGKVGSFNLGYLGSVDEAGDDDDPNAVVNIFRGRQDIGRASSIGTVYTDRSRSGDDFNRVAGLDSRLVLGDRYTVTLLGARSWDRDGDDAEDGATQSGNFFSARVERAGREFEFNAEIEDHAPDFRARSGFLRRVGETQLDARIELRRFGAPGAFLENWGPNIQFRGFWDHDAFWAGDGLKERQLELSTNFSFRNRINVFLTYALNRFDYRPEAYEGLFTVVGDDEFVPFRVDQSLFGGLDRFSMNFFMNAWEKVRGNIRFDLREEPVFSRALGVPTELGDQWGGEVSIDLFPLPNLTADLRLRHETIDRKLDGSRYSSATIPRIEVQYQFSRSLFLRAITEYGAQERHDLLDPETGLPLALCEEAECTLQTGSDANDVHVEGLLAFEPSPGTVFFAGYTRDMEDEDAFSFRNVQPRQQGFFIKLSYLFRL